MIRILVRSSVSPTVFLLGNNSTYHKDFEQYSYFDEN